MPGGRTVDPAVTDGWTLGGITREIPIIASAMDGVVDVGMCVELAKQGALGVLNLEGVQAATTTQARSGPYCLGG